MFPVDPPSNPPSRPRKRPIFRGRVRGDVSHDPHLRSGVFHEPPEMDVYSPDPMADDYTDPHDFDELPERPRILGPLRFWPSSREAITPAIIALTALILSAWCWGGGNDGALWASGESVLVHGEWQRLVTALFLHGDITHWANNMWLMILFGWLLKGYFGRVAFPVVSFLCGALSNAFTVWMYEPYVRLYGASGMVYAMVAMWLVLYIRYDVDTRPGARLTRAIGFALLMLFPQTYEPTTSYAAHASGFVAGLVAALIMLPWIRPRVSP